MKITINDKEIELKNSIRSLMMYENIEGSTFKFDTLNNIITYFYCVTLTSSKDYTLEFDQFVDFIDGNPTVIEDFVKWMTTIDQNQNKLKKD